MAQFLRRALSLFRDSDIGIVQTPQHFMNPDPLQSNLSAARVWPGEQRYFFGVVMAAKDAWGASSCCGTSSVSRFDVLQAFLLFCPGPPPIRYGCSRSFVRIFYGLFDVQAVHADVTETLAHYLPYFAAEVVTSALRSVRPTRPCWRRPGRPPFIDCSMSPSVGRGSTWSPSSALRARA
jgi:cellulose synthase/poly-beta-1,6-N-acetylglucosamine synthase-like glycosyltransferase